MGVGGEVKSPVTVKPCSSNYKAVSHTLLVTADCGDLSVVYPQHEWCMLRLIFRCKELFKFISFSRVFVFRFSYHRLNSFIEGVKCDSRLRNQNHVWLSPAGWEISRKNVGEEAGWLLVLVCVTLGKPLNLSGFQFISEVRPFVTSQGSFQLSYSKQASKSTFKSPSLTLLPRIYWGVKKKSKESSGQPLWPVCWFSLSTAGQITSSRFCLWC